MSENPFTVRVPDISQAFDEGAKGYSFVSGLMKERAVGQAREQAAQHITQGGDPTEALGLLIKIGDDKGAATLATLMHNKQTGDYQNRSLAATVEHQRATEKQGAASLAETSRFHSESLAEQRRQHEVAGMQPVKIGSNISGDIYAIKDPSSPGGLRIVDVNALQGRQPAAAPGSAVPSAPLTGEDYLKTLPPDVQPLIKKIAGYEMDPKNSSIMGGHRERLLSAVAQYDPTYDAATFPAKSKAVRDFSTGTQGNAVRSFDVAIDHLDTMEQYAKALKNGDVNFLNSARNKIKEQLGYEAPTNFDATKSIVGAEIAKAIVGGQNALQDRAELRDAFNNARSPEQLAGVIGAYKKLMAGQLKGLEKQYGDTTGRKDFRGRLRENTAKQLLDEAQGSQTPALPPGFQLVKP